jgi:hypothetical protein
MSENNTFNNFNFVFNKNDGVEQSLIIDTSTVGLSIEYDKHTTNPKTFRIRPSGINFTDNTNNNTTGLERLSLIQQAFQAVQLPPNATTLKVNKTILCDAGIANQTSSLEDGKITVNNGTLNGIPLSINNIGNNGILFNEFYNQRTATTGEFNRLSFYSKNSAGNKVEYSRIHQNTPGITAGSERGRMDFTVRETGGLVDYLRLNGNNQNVEFFRSVNMNNYNISNASTISSTLGSFFTLENVPTGLTYKPSYDQIVNTISTTIPVPQYAGQRLFVFQEGITDPSSSYINPSPISQSPSNDNYCCAFFAGYIFAGMSSSLYYWDTGSSSWVNIYNFNASIICMKEFNSYLYIGGNFQFDNSFTTQFNHIARMDIGFSVTSITWNNTGDIGFDNSVYTFCPNDIGSSYLYVGGVFTRTGSSFYPLDYFGCIETNNLDLYSIDNNSGGGTNGFNAPVRAIACYSNRIFIGGEFTSQIASIFGSQNTYSIQYGCFWTSNDYISLNNPEFENIGNFGPSSLNNWIYKAVKDPTGNPFIHFGGEFTSLDNLYNYLAYVDATSPTSLGGNNTFSRACYSLDIVGSTVVSKEGASRGQIYFPIQNIQISSSSPRGNMSACVDSNTGLYQFFFSGDDTITAYNPTLTTTIDLASLGIGIIKNGSTYYTSAVILGQTGYIHGIAVLPNSISPLPCYVIVSDYVVSYN